MGSFRKQTIEKDQGMTSERQIAANRRNAQRSTGPRSPEGREISSRNSQQHGVLSQRVTTDVEEKEIYERMLNSFMEEYGPRSEKEILLVERLANLFWRERRLIQTERSQLSFAARRCFCGGKSEGPVAHFDRSIADWAVSNDVNEPRHHYSSDRKVDAKRNR